MLRVEASNLPVPRGAPRPRRLLPNPPNVKRRAPRQELVPPAAVEAAAPAEAVISSPTASSPDRWSVQLELKDADIAKLYGQGMTRGAVVWRKGMVEWRPLLVTPELTALLRRTRTTLTELTTSPLAELTSPPLTADDLTLPRPARLPSDLAPPIAEAHPPLPQISSYPDKPRFTTVAPTAIDVEREPASPRRRIELAAVAVAAFALAWITHGRLSSSSNGDAPVAAAAFAAAPAPAPACEPTPTSKPSTVASPASTIPTVAVSDLPLAGSRASASETMSTALVSARASKGARTAANRAVPSRSASAAAPTRGELMGALGQVASAANGCGERNGPVRIVMSFGSSGVARSIQVSGAGLPAQTRSCIIGAASRARVPAFSGDPVTVSKTL